MGQIMRSNSESTNIETARPAAVTTPAVVNQKVKKIAIASSPSISPQKENISYLSNGKCVFRSGNNFRGGDCPAAAPTLDAPASHAQNSPYNFSIDEKVTIGMACSQYQMNGDIVGYQSCNKRQLALAASSGSMPSMENLSIDEKVTIQMACSDYQMAGDIVGYKSCMRSQVRMSGR